MKKLLLTFLILLNFSLLWTEDQNSKRIANLSVTTGYFSGYKISLGKASSTVAISSELTLSYKADVEFTFTPKMKGENSINHLYLQWNRFYNPYRTKSFLILRGGVFWVTMRSWFSGTGSEKIYILPTISVGYGYSFKLNERSFIRPSIDLGFQVNVVNIEVSYFFDF